MSTPLSCSEYDYLFKIVLIGNSSTGKTSLIQRFTDHNFNGDTQKATVGVQFHVATLPLQSGRKAKLQIWDTAGQERYRAISSAYYRGAHAVLVVFDLGNQKSFDDLQVWLEEIRMHHPQAKERIYREQYEDELEYELAYEEQKLGQPILHLIGNKSDLPSEERLITREMANAYAEQHDMEYMETSAKIGSGVFDAFLKLATSMEKQYEAAMRLDSAQEKKLLSKSSTIQLHEEEQQKGAPVEQQKRCNC